jgi:hypothetical protein
MLVRKVGKACCRNFFPDILKLINFVALFGLR